MRALTLRFVCALLFTSGFGYGQLSRLDEIDQRLSLDRHQKILNSSVVIDDPAINTNLKDIAERISRTSYFAQYPFAPQIFYLREPIVNAMSNGGGRVYVFNGLVQVVQSNRGILAFVVGHEMAHNRLQHAARDYMRRVVFETEYRRLRVQSPRSALAYKVAWYITEKKIERDEENQADRLGLQAAAEAGYHPDYAILAARVLREQLPDHSKFVTFFNSNHPRWITREERTGKNYAETLGLFEKFWPDTAASPGGIPPPLAIVSPVRIDKNRNGITTSTQLQVRNLRGQTAILTATIAEEGKSPRVVFTRAYSSDGRSPELLSFAIPPETLNATGKKGSLLVDVKAGNDTLYESSPISLHSSHRVGVLR